MALQDEIRNDLEAEVFNEFGKTVTLVTYSSQNENAWGEIDGATEVQTSIIAVPYDIIDDRKSSEPFGQLKAGDMALAVPYTVSIAKGDQLIIESERWEVVEVSKNYLPNNVVTICQLRRTRNVVSDD